MKNIFITLLLGSASMAHAQDIGFTPNQENIGAVLATPVGTPTTSTQSVRDVLDIADPSLRAVALGQLSPQAYSLLPELSLNASDAQEINILRYLRDLRGTAETPDGEQLSVEEQGRLGLFVTGGARMGKFKSAIDRPRVDNDSVMVMGGANYRLMPKTTIGAFGGYMHSDVDLSPMPGGGSQQKNWFAGGFGTLGVGPLYVDIWGSYTDLDWRLARGYAFGTTSGISRGRTNGQVWSAGAATGLSFSAGNFEIEPYAAIRYADIKLDGFTESGSPGDLTIGRIKAESLRLNLGGRIGTKFEVAGVMVRPQLRGGWYKEFKLDDSRTIPAAFADGAIGSPFTFATTPLTDEFYNVGAALNIAGNGPLSMAVDYDVQFDDDRQYHAISLSGRYKF